jgi:hypothetical protein
LEDGVEKFRDHTVVSGLGVRVVDRMMSGTLQDPQIMEKVYPRAVFAAAAVRPFVDLVGVSDQGGKEPDGGCEHSESPSGGEDQAGDEPQVPTRGYPGFAEEMAGSVVMEDVGACDELAQDRAVVAEVGVFDPMEYADEKIGGEDSQGRGSEGFADAECPRNDLIHDPAFVAVCWKVA